MGKFKADNTAFLFNLTHSRHFPSKGTGKDIYNRSDLGPCFAGGERGSELFVGSPFNGYTPEVAASVAFYRDDATQSLNGIGGLTSVTGGSFPARIWAEFVKGYLKKSPVQEFPAPAYIGGTEAINFINAVPEMDPALIPPSPSPTKKKR